ncbi:MAG: hypothetical protein IOD11_17210 [Rhodocyclaceae bacterium]|nr:hypothetical protein [Rhodocyclaceae bacterium]
MITLNDYYMGRDRTHGHLLGSDLRANAARTVESANALLVLAKTAGVSLEANPRTGSIVSSGWRPPDINGATPGAALRSLHMQCLAVDLFDPDGDLDDWLLANNDTVLRDMALWLEHPAATKGWAHVQLRPPRSGRRVFYP